MKMPLILMLTALLAAPALAGLDPATDSFGVYFDLEGNTNCTTASMGQVVNAYLLLLNPAGPTDGFECSIALTGAQHVVLSTVFANGCNLDIDWEPAPGDLIGACPASYPVPESGAVLLVSWVFMMQSSSELMFHLGPASIPSLPGGLPVVTGNGILRRWALSSGSPSLPVAGINAGNCPVSEETSAFGAVKGLFR